MSPEGNMDEQSGLQRLGDVSLRDIARGVSRYKSPIALFLAVALLAVLLPGKGGDHKTASNVATGSVASGGADTSAATDAGPTATDQTATTVAAAAATAGRTATAAAGATRGATATGATKTVAAPAVAISAHGTDPACDAATGRVRYPSLYAVPCTPPYGGDNGGSTYQGVSGTQITMCVPQAASTPQGQAIATALGDSDTREQINQTTDDYVHLFEHHYQTWGRTINLQRFDESGTDDAAGKSDAIHCAKDLKAFMSVGGPNNAYYEEIVANKMLCFCTVTMPKDYYLSRAPYVWGTGLEDYEQEFTLVAEMIGKQINGHKAKYAGDATMQLQDRSFGWIHYDTTDGAYSAGLKIFTGELNKYGVKLTDQASYTFDLNSAQQDSQTIMSKFQSEGITSVIFAGDPIYPEFFTTAATKQNYFPEWIITGTALTDTAFFARIYDKSQWAHAFGLSLLAARGPNDQAEYYRVHQAEYGSAPPATSASPVIYSTWQQIFTALTLAGPDLNPQTYRDGLFSYPVTPAKPGITVSTISWGKHLWGWDDYNAIDDSTEIFWDNTAQGPDETGHNGTGMYRYVHMGKRYLPGQFANEEFKAFADSQDNILIYDQLPAQDQPPKYDWKRYYCPPKPTC